LKILLALSLALAACTSRVPSVTQNPPAAGGPHVTILHLNDVYEITPVGDVGGLARVATLRERLARERGQVITTLGGDFLSPSALGTARVDGLPLAGAQMVGVLNAMGLDWATLGNHEFDIAEPLFRARVAESRFRYVSSNVTDSAGRLFPSILNHAIVQVAVAGRVIRLGLIGIVLPANGVPWVRYTDQYESARAHARMIRDSVDAVIALTHQYFYEDARLATEVPEIDLILGGHEHDNMVLRRGPTLTPILKADGNAASVQVATLRFGAPGARPVITSELVPITSGIQEDAATRAEVERWLVRAFAGYEQDGFAPRKVIAHLTEPLDARETTIRAGANRITDLMLASMKREAPDADIAFFNAGTIRVDDVVQPGPLTEYDVIRILPFGGPLVRATITGRVLSDVHAAGRRNRGGGGFLHFLGLDASGDTLRFRGAPIDPARAYSIVTVDFLMTGRQGNLEMLNRTNPEITGVRDLRDARRPMIEELSASYPPRP
jgi:5'-nucleotidase